MSKRECIRSLRATSFLLVMIALVATGGAGCRDTYDNELPEVPSVGQTAEFESGAQEEGTLDSEATLDTATELDEEAEELPRTASPLPLLSLAGVVSLFAALGLRIARR